MSDLMNAKQRVEAAVDASSVAAGDRSSLEPGVICELDEPLVKEIIEEIPPLLQQHLPPDFTYNDGRSPPWRVVPVPNRGLASFATRAYVAGEVIFRENPLLWVPFHWPFKKKHLRIVEMRVGKLSDVDAAIFYASSNVYDVPPIAPSRAAGVFYTNSFDMTGAKHGESCGIFPMLARLNHSCSPNTRQEFDVNTLEEVLYASTNIEDGEQLFDSYTDLMANVKVRRRELRKYYRFDCDCERCVKEGGPVKRRDGNTNNAVVAVPVPDMSKLDISKG
jgi:hypothetical protein